MREQINKIFKQCLQKVIDPTQAVETIDKLIGGITGVSFKAGKKFTLQNPLRAYSLRYNFALVPRKQQSIAAEMAYCAYERAMQNTGNIYCGDLHINRVTSTKHHYGGLLDKTNRRLIE